MIGAVTELSTERVNGMSAGSIPLSKIWDYIDRFNLPDWWEPVILQSDVKMLSSANKETRPSDNHDKVVGRKAGSDGKDGSPSRKTA